MIRDELYVAKTTAQVELVYQAHPELHTNPDFVYACRDRYKEIIEVTKRYEKWKSTNQHQTSSSK